MQPIFKSLLKVIDASSGSEHASAYWKKYLQATAVEHREGEELFLKGIGFGCVEEKNHHPLRKKALKNALHSLERWSYRKVSREYAKFPALWRLTRDLASRLNVYLTYDLWKYTMALSVLADFWEKENLQPNVFVLIGDGHGFLGALIKKYCPEAILYFIDFPKVLIFQAQTQQICHPQHAMTCLTPEEPRPAAINFVPPDNIEQIPMSVDCAINVDSMQEMTEGSIATYFNFLRRRSHPASHFYCVNRLSNKLMDGNKVEFEKFPWSKKDTIFMDGVCPYHRHFFSLRRTCNVHGEPTQGPKILGRRIPFVNYFDGVVLHRLVHLAKEELGMFLV